MPRYCIRSDNFRAISYFLDYPIYTPLPRTRAIFRLDLLSLGRLFFFCIVRMARGSSARVIVEELERGDLSDRGLLIKMKRVNFWDGVILGGGDTFLFFFFFTINQSSLRIISNCEYRTNISFFVCLFFV